MNLDVGVLKDLERKFFVKQSDYDIIFKRLIDVSKEFYNGYMLKRAVVFVNNDVSKEHDVNEEVDASKVKRLLDDKLFHDLLVIQSLLNETVDCKCSCILKNEYTVSMDIVELLIEVNEVNKVIIDIVTLLKRLSLKLSNDETIKDITNIYTKVTSKLGYFEINPDTFDNKTVDMLFKVLAKRITYIHAHITNILNEIK